MFKRILITRRTPVWLFSLTLALGLALAGLVRAQPDAVPEGPSDPRL